jgi:copper chaperone
MTEKTFHVPSISCGHCVNTIQREVGELPGVASVAADESSKRVTLAWDDAATSWDEVVALMEEINFPVAEEDR